MYRALGLKTLDAGVDPADATAVAELLPETEILLAPSEGHLRVLLDGEPVEDRIRTQEVGAAASAVAAHSEVRRRMVDLQRQSAEHSGGVLEGRDVGTKVFPDTPHKFFLDARPEVRHRRRYDQLQGQGQEVSLEEVARQVEHRDARDSGREDSPLTCDETYHRVDASDLSAEEVVEKMLVTIRGGRAIRG